jgi:hypothetical protein
VFYDSNGELDSVFYSEYGEYDMASSGIVTPSGAKSKLALGLQTNWATAAVGTHIAEYRSGGAQANRINVYSQALRDTPSQKIKGQVSDFEATGSVVVELTPEGTLPLLLTALFGAPTTTTYYADITGTPTTWAVGTTYAEDAKVLRKGYYYTSVAGGNVGNDPACTDQIAWTPVPDVTSGITASLRSYRHVWKHKWDTKFVSMHQLKGSTVEAFVRGLVTGFNIGVSRGARDIITGSFDVRFANSFIAETFDDVIEPGAGYDTLPPWSASKGKVTVNGVVGGSFREFNAAVSRQITDRLVLNGKIGPDGFNNNGSDTSGSLNAYFDTEAMLYAFMGYASAYTKPAGFTGLLVYNDVVCSLAYDTPGSGGSPLNYDSKLVVRFPHCLFGSVSQPIAGREEIMQSITLEPCLDPTEDCDVIFEVWNRQANASILTAGSALTVPCSDVE